MYLPFVGLVLAVVWSGFLPIEKAAAGKHGSMVRRAALAGSLALLAAYGYGVHLRNRVWSSDAALWRDNVRKCPHNGRGWMNYGLTQMAVGNYSDALDSFLRALIYTPNYPTLEINLGVVYGAMQQPAEAERHFLRAVALAPANDEARFFYGRWLKESGRMDEALHQLQIAVQLNPPRMPTHDLLAETYAALGDTENAHAAALETLRLDPTDASAKAILDRSWTQSADDWINISLHRYQTGDYAGCIAAARKAIQLNPNAAIAYNNIAAAYAAMRQWEPAVEAARQALRLQPGFQLAKNNLAWALSQKQMGEH